MGVDVGVSINVRVRVGVVSMIHFKIIHPQEVLFSGQIKKKYVFTISSRQISSIPSRLRVIELLNHSKQPVYEFCRLLITQFVHFLAIILKFFLILIASLKCFKISTHSVSKIWLKIRAQCS